VIAAIFADVLKLERVGIHDDFFELGGHSLRATQVLARVDENFRVNLTVAGFFLHPTVNAVAETLAEALGGIERANGIAAVLQEVNVLTASQVQEALLRLEGSAGTGRIDHAVDGV
jgi:acyl carrier protein